MEYLSPIFASNPVSRFLAHVKAPFQFGDKEKWSRLKLLRAATAIKNILEDIEDAVLSTNDTSISEAVYKSKDLFHIFDSDIAGPIVKYLYNIPEIDKKQDIPKDDELKNIKYQFDQLKDGLTERKRELTALKSSINSEKFKPFSNSYNELLRKINHINQQKFIDIEYANDLYLELLNDLESFRNAIDSIKDLNLIKDAGKLTKWLKRKKLKYLEPNTDRQRSLRLKTDTHINNIKSTLNQLMNTLEKGGITPGALVNNVKLIAESMIGMYNSLSILADLYNNDARLTKMEDKGVKIYTIPNTDIGLLKNNVKLLTDLIVNFGQLQEARGI